MNNITNKYRKIEIPKRFRFSACIIRESLDQYNLHLKPQYQVYK